MPMLPRPAALRRLCALALCAAALPLFAACADARMSTPQPLPFSLAQASPGEAAPGAAPDASRPGRARRAPILRGGPFGSYLAGRLAQRESDTAPAADFLGRALAADPSDREVLRRAFIANLADGREREAVRLAEQVIDRRAGERVLPTLVLVADNMREGNFAQAEARLKALPATGLGDILKPLLVAWAQQARGDTIAALGTLRPLADRSAQRFFHLYALHAALIADLADRPAEARGFLATALGNGAAAEAPPRELRLARITASFFARRGERERAERLLRGFFAQSASEDLAAAEAAMLAAIDALQVADPRAGMAEALLALAAALREQDAGEPALAILRVALMLRPDFPAALLVLSDLLDSESRVEAALAALARIPDAAPLAATARLRSAVLLDRLDRTDEAIATLERLAAAEPARPEALVRQGDVLRGRRRFAEAVTAYDRAAERKGALTERRHWTFLYSRAIALERSGQWDRAEADFLKALELVPDQPYVLNYLGYSWVERGRNLERARQMIERAVALRPRDGQIVDSLGWVFFMLGDFANAVRWLERAVELTPRDPILSDHLGDAYWRVGRQAEARFQWQRALSLEPEADQMPVIERKLREGLPALPTPASAGRERDTPAPARP